MKLWNFLLFRTELDLLYSITHELSIEFALISCEVNVSLIFFQKEFYMISAAARRVEFGRS